MIDQTLDALLILQEADMRRKGMEQRLALLPKEMDAIIARRDKLNASTAVAAEALKKRGAGDQILRSRNCPVDCRQSETAAAIRTGQEKQ